MPRPSTGSSNALSLIGLRLDSIIGSPGLTASARNELRGAREELALAIIDMSTRDVLGALTTAEMKVLTQLARGVTTKVIADELFLSVATVKSHLSGIYQKLNVSSRAEAIVLSKRLGMIS